MNQVKFYKRVLTYLFDYILCIIVSLLALLILYTRSYVGVGLYLLYSYIGSVILMFFYTLIVEYLADGYTLFSRAFSYKIVKEDNKKLRLYEVFIRACLECLFIFPLLDLFYFIAKRTNRGSIDRISNTYAISTKDFSL